MLSGETSVGIQPLKVVDTMRKTIKDAEKSMEDFEFKNKRPCEHKSKSG